MNRLTQLRKNRGLNQSELAKILNVSQATLSNWERGVHDVDQSNLVKLVDFFDVTSDYLLNIEKEVKGWVKIPVLGVVAAGTPISAIENTIGYEEIPASWTTTGDEYFGLKIKGSSMEPRMVEGDTVICIKQSTCENNDTAVVLVDNENATVKMIQKHKEGITLVPFNRSFNTVFYTNKEIGDRPVSIIGKVVQLIASF